MCIYRLIAQNGITHYVNVLIYSVSWHVLETMKTVSDKQLQALRETIMNGEEPTPSHSAPNFRGAKSNGHTVHKCSAGNGDSDESD